MSPKRFIFDSYDFDRENHMISLKYRFDDELIFEEQLSLAKGEFIDIPEEVLDRALFNLHLIGGVSYYKAYCPKEIVVESGSLSKEEAAFWDKLYTQGLGEFFYQNEIDFRNLVQFPFESGTRQAQHVELPEKSLLPLGGGKDSIVAAELLKEAGKDFDIFNMGDYITARKVSEVMGKKMIVVKRQLSKELFRLNDEGAYNGHVPISAYIAFLSLVMGLLYGYKYAVLANERSANEGNARFHDLEVNHQYSKSFEFEKDFNSYVQRFVTPDFYYFSLLRPYYELKIAEMFSNYPQYFEVFTSCNRNFKQGAKGEGFWCSECAKCAFVFSIMTPFVEKDELLKIFGKNLFADESLWPLFAELLGMNGIKPFDCVGTPEEVQEALFLATENYAGDAIVQRFMKEANIGNAYEDLYARHEESLIPESFADVLPQERVLILGYGREGQTTLKFFQENFPEHELVVADQNTELKIDGMEVQLGEEWLKDLDRFDLIVKSPGIPWNDELLAVEDRVSSATQLFFSMLDPSNLVIAVTGSKGKSTTATLIHGMLSAAGKECVLVGNIGSPALELVDRTDSVFVFELSSYQLDRLMARPDIAVMTSFFPDHINWHGTLENYLEAKANICKYQLPGDVFVYLKKYAEIDALETEAEKIAVEEVLPVKTKLLGEHNQDNIALVFEVAKLMNVDLDIVQDMVENFTGLPHRLENVGEFKGMTFINDALSTTPESTIAAIRTFGENVGTIFLGGTDRGYNFKKLGAVIAEYAVPNVIILPDTGSQILAAFPSNYSPKVLKTCDVKEGLSFAVENGKSGQVVLLSTASPSFSLYEDYAGQGEDFRNAVHELKTGE